MVKCRLVMLCADGSRCVMSDSEALELDDMRDSRDRVRLVIVTQAHSNYIRNDHSYKERKKKKRNCISHFLYCICVVLIIIIIVIFIAIIAIIINDIIIIIVYCFARIFIIAKSVTLQSPDN